MPPIPPTEGQLLAIRESLAPPSFTLHINQWPFLAVDLWVGKSTCFQKGAQLGKAGGNAPKRRFPVQHVGFWIRRKPTTQKHINRRFHRADKGHWGWVRYLLMGKRGIWVGRVIDIVNCGWVECVRGKSNKKAVFH
jgi:hypothetical protein